MEGLVPNLLPPICNEHRIVEGGPVSRHTQMLDDWEHWNITALDGVPSVCLYAFVCT